jgi:hypothetical protein
MKYIISENQLKTLLKEDRVQFLKGQYVIDPKILDKSVDGELESGEERIPGGMNPLKDSVKPLQNHDGIDLAYKVKNKKGKESIKLTDQTFNDIVTNDPTSNKQYVQWIINVFLKHIAEGDEEAAIRFVSEDLPEVNEFLGIFDKVKNKKIFKRSAPNRPNAPQNVSDINQYNSLSHLYNVISPFIETADDEDEDGEGEGSESALWKKLKKYIDLGEAKLAYRDGNVLIYTPLTIESSCEPLGPLASWCTRREGNSYFDSYRRDKPKPDGSLSDYYVIMPKEIFNEKDNDIYPLQFHFESGQLHDKSNASIDKPGAKITLQEVLSKYSGLRNFFLKELTTLAEMDIKKGSGLMESKYIDYLNKFGGSVESIISPEVYKQGVESIKQKASEDKGPLNNNRYLKWLLSNVKGISLIEFLNPDVEKLDFNSLTLGELPDLSNFKNLTNLTAEGCGLTKLPSLDKLPEASKLQVASFRNNNIKDVNLTGWSTKFPNIFALNISSNPVVNLDINGLVELTENELMVFRIDPGNLNEESLAKYNEWLNSATDSNPFLSK